MHYSLYLKRVQSHNHNFTFLYLEEQNIYKQKQNY